MRALLPLIYSNLYVSACAASLVLATQALLSGAARVDALSALVFFATLLVYNLDRLASGGEDRLDPSPRHQWVRRHQGVLLGVLGVAALGVAACVLLLPWHIFLALVPLGVLSVGYSLPVLSWGGRRHRRLKELPGLKIFMIALVWAVATVSLPAWLAGRAPWQGQVLALTVERALFIMAITLPFDVRDMGKDRGAGILTLPHLLGVEGTRRLAIGLVLASWLVGALAVGVATAHALALAVSALATCALLSALHARRGELYYALWMEGTMLAQAVCVLVAGWLAG